MQLRYYLDNNLKMFKALVINGAEYLEDTQYSLFYLYNILYEMKGEETFFVSISKADRYNVKIRFRNGKVVDVRIGVDYLYIMDNGVTYKYSCNHFLRKIQASLEEVTTTMSGRIIKEKYEPHLITLEVIYPLVTLKFKIPMEPVDRFNIDYLDRLDKEGNIYDLRRFYTQYILKLQNEFDRDTSTILEVEKWEEDCVITERLGLRDNKIEFREFAKEFGEIKAIVREQEKGVRKVEIEGIKGELKVDLNCLVAELLDSLDKRKKESNIVKLERRRY